MIPFLLDHNALRKRMSALPLPRHNTAPNGQLTGFCNRSSASRSPTRTPTQSTAVCYPLLHANSMCTTVESILIAWCLQQWTRPSSTSSASLTRTRPVFTFRLYHIMTIQDSITAPLPALFRRQLNFWGGHNPYAWLARTDDGLVRYYLRPMENGRRRVLILSLYRDVCWIVPLLAAGGSGCNGGESRASRSFADHV